MVLGASELVGGLLQRLVVIEGDDHDRIVGATGSWVVPPMYRKVYVNASTPVR